jgi:hypothetical protein
MKTLIALVLAALMVAPAIAGDDDERPLVKLRAGYGDYPACDQPGELHLLFMIALAGRL